MEDYERLNTQNPFKPSNSLYAEILSERDLYYSPRNSYSRYSLPVEEAHSEFLKSEVKRLREELYMMEIRHEEELLSIKRDQEKEVKNIMHDKEYSLQLEISVYEELELTVAEEMDWSSEIRKETIRNSMEHTEEVKKFRNMISGLKGEKMTVEETQLKPVNRELKEERNSLMEKGSLSAERISEIKVENSAEIRALKKKLEEYREEEALLVSEVEKIRGKLLEASGEYENTVTKTHDLLKENMKLSSREENKFKKLKGQREKGLNEIKEVVESLVLLKEQIEKEVKVNKILQEKRLQLQKIS